MRVLLLPALVVAACGGSIGASDPTGTVPGDRLRGGALSECGTETRCLRVCDDGDAQACVDLGLVFEARGELEEAADSYGRGCDHGDEACCARQVTTLRALGREGEADAVLRRLCPDDGSGERCRALVTLGESGEVNSDFEGVLEGRCRSGDAIACRDLGRALHRLGRVESAEPALTRACEAGDLEGCLLLSDVLTELGRDADAARARSSAAALGSDD